MNINNYFMMPVNVNKNYLTATRVGRTSFVPVETEEGVEEALTDSVVLDDGADVVVDDDDDESPTLLRLLSGSEDASLMTLLLLEVALFSNCDSLNTVTLPPSFNVIPLHNNFTLKFLSPFGGTTIS